MFVMQKNDTDIYLSGKMILDFLFMSHTYKEKQHSRQLVYIWPSTGLLNLVLDHQDYDAAIGLNVNYS